MSKPSDIKTEIQHYGRGRERTPKERIACLECRLSYYENLPWYKFLWRHSINKKGCYEYIDCEGCLNNYNGGWEKCREEDLQNYTEIKAVATTTGRHTSGTPIKDFRVNVVNKLENNIKFW